MKQTVMLMAGDESRLTMLVDSLSQAGFDVVARFSPKENLLLRVNEIDPDLIVIDLDVPEHGLLTQLKVLNELKPKPVVLFAEKGEGPVVNAVVKAGVSAFVIDGLTARRIKPVMDLAMARFKETSSLQQELEKTKTSLKDRKTIDQAKGIIMKQRQVDEAVAYKALREMAMKQNMKIPDVAKSIISVAELLT